jgi:hypothetical protein
VRHNWPVRHGGQCGPHPRRCAPRAARTFVTLRFELIALGSNAKEADTPGLTERTLALRALRQVSALFRPAPVPDSPALRPLNFSSASASQIALPLRPFRSRKLSRPAKTSGDPNRDTGQLLRR